MQQVSVAALYMLMRKAYDHYVDKTTNNNGGDIVILPYDVLLIRRGARDSKIGKKWPESSIILDYILC